MQFKQKTISKVVLFALNFEPCLSHKFCYTF